MSRPPKPGPIFIRREVTDVVCPQCGRTVHVSNGRLPFHVVDPTAWRGKWCAGSDEVLAVLPGRGSDA